MILLSGAAHPAGRSEGLYLEMRSVLRELHSSGRRGLRRVETSELIREVEIEDGIHCLLPLSRRRILPRGRLVSYSHGW